MNQSHLPPKPPPFASLGPSSFKSTTLESPQSLTENKQNALNKFILYIDQFQSNYINKAQ
jgi:hypothetical protein